MQSHRFVEQEDHDMQWLAREAPQFHTHVEPQRPSPTSSASQEYCDDASSTSSDSDSACSDSDDDPLHPYNFNNPTQKWIRDGDFVYAADDLQNNYLSEDRHVSGDAPYIPDTEEDENKETFSPAEIPRPDLYEEPYIYRDAPPSSQDIQTLSPLVLTSSLPSSPAPAPPATENTRSRRTRASFQRDAYSFDSEDEADMSSGDDASEDEYVPSPRISSRKLPTSSRRHSHGRIKSRAAARLSYSPYPSSSTSTSAGESSSRRPGSRNVQVIDQAPPPRGSWDKTGPNAYKCPYCDHVQKNKRSPDMERHIRSHFRRTGQAQWVCCGLPLKEAMKHGRDRNDHPWVFNGVLMVGGCHEDFSRMDALKRHWRNANNSCIGEISYARVKDEPSQ